MAELTKKEEEEEEEADFFKMQARRVVKHAIGFHRENASDERATDLPGLGLLMAYKCFAEDGTKSWTDLPEHVLRAVSDVSNPARVASTRGPLAIVLSENNELPRHVVEVFDLFIHTELGPRRAACDFLHELIASHPDAISGYSRESFHEAEQLIRSRDATEWYPAALGLLETLENDFLLNLAGFRQSLPLPSQFENERMQFWSRVLKPRVAPHQYVSYLEFFPATKKVCLQEQVQACIVSEDCDRTISAYVAAFRHLPMSEPYSLATVIRDNSWERTAFTVLVDLAKNGKTLERYQACQALCDMSTSWNESERQIVADVVEAFLLLMFAPQVCGTSGLLWNIHKMLAGHYVGWCELLEPNWTPDAVSALAWWLADRVVGVIGEHSSTKDDADTYLEKVVSDILRPAIEETRIFFQTIRQPTDESLYRYTTLQHICGSPFGFSIAASLSNLLPSISGVNLGENQHGWFNLVVGPLYLCCDVLPDSPGFVMTGKAAECVAAGEIWTQLSVEEIRQYVDQRKPLVITLRDDQTLETSIISLPATESLLRVEQLQMMHSLAIAGQLPADAVWRAIQNPNFRQDTAEKFDDMQLELLMNVIITVGAGTDAAWRWQLPFVLASMVSLLEGDVDRSRIIVGAIIACCAANRSCASLRELFNQHPHDAIGKSLSTYRAYLSINLHSVPKWAQSRIRAILANIP